MAEPADPGPIGSLRDLADRLLPGGGATARGRVEATLDELVERGELTRSGADELLDELRTASAGTGHRLLGDRAAGVLGSLADQLGLVKERRVEELELRVAQLEHRLRLLESATDRPGGDEAARTP
jgi:polyhydroxyalkanoate synthesis regulator phasin